VAPREQGHEEALDHGVLADDGLADFFAEFLGPSPLPGVLGERPAAVDDEVRPEPVHRTASPLPRRSGGSGRPSDASGDDQERERRPRKPQGRPGGPRSSHGPPEGGADPHEPAPRANDPGEPGRRLLAAVLGLRPSLFQTRTRTRGAPGSGAAPHAQVPEPSQKSVSEASSRNAPTRAIRASVRWVRKLPLGVHDQEAPVADGPGGRPPPGDRQPAEGFHRVDVQLRQGASARGVSSSSRPRAPRARPARARSAPSSPGPQVGELARPGEQALLERADRRS
jgi:hypothetical protein